MPPVTRGQARKSDASGIPTVCTPAVQRSAQTPRTMRRHTIAEADSRDPNLKQYGDQLLRIVDEKIFEGERYYRVIWENTLEPVEQMRQQTPLLIEYFELYTRIKKAGQFRIVNWIKTRARETRNPYDLLYTIAFGKDQEQMIVNHEFLDRHFRTEHCLFLAAELNI
ncbi:hypothetical protein L596_023510 [Steinernema carpocapsae]|uniref:Chromo domain-containing protein n=1 Tax=Steinernema carpocapsae TaxID=34508 RepID=A0A4U5ME35_STECR|nr:hypothetical protein L596_023510 [Steinernema carpocapsae]